MSEPNTEQRSSLGRSESDHSLPLSREASPSLFDQAFENWLAITGQRTRCLLILLCAVLAGFFEAFAISSFSKLVQSSEPSLQSSVSELGQFSNIPEALNWFLISSAFALTLAYVAENQSWKFRTRVEKIFRKALLHAMRQLDWSQAAAIHSGSIQRSFTYDAYEAAEGAFSLVRAAAALVTLIGLSALIALHSVTWFLFASSCLLLVVIGYAAYHRRLWNVLRITASKLQSNSELMTDRWSCLKYARSTEECFFATKVLQEEIDTCAARVESNRLSYPKIAFVTRLACLTILGLLLIYFFRFSSANLLNFFVPVALLYKSLPYLVSFHQHLHQVHCAFPFLLNIRRFQNVVPSTRLNEESLAPEFRHNIELKNIVVRYGKYQVLHGASMAIPLGSTIGITGKSGSGKSTLADLLTGLTKADEGSVLVDGLDYQNLDLCAWRQRIGIVLHESLLFPGTLQDNITWGQKFVSEKMNRVLALTGLTELVCRLPNGLASFVEEGGKNFSRGQQQRIALTRALYREPWLLILDEPSTALDDSAQDHLASVIRSLRGSVTIIIMTHDPALLTLCSKVYRIESGQLVRNHRSLPSLTQAPQSSLTV